VSGSFLHRVQYGQAATNAWMAAVAYGLVQVCWPLRGGKKRSLPVSHSELRGPQNRRLIHVTHPNGEGHCLSHTMSSGVPRIKE
jgi:hypothetical protein